MKIAQKRNNVVKESKLPNIKLQNEVCCSLRDDVARENHAYRTICFSSTSQSNFFSSSQQNFGEKFCVLIVNGIKKQHTKFFPKIVLGTWKKI